MKLYRFVIHSHSILSVTEVSTGLVKLLFEAKHRNLLKVWTRSRRRMVKSFFTTPSNVCWYVSSNNLSSMYHLTLGKGSPESQTKWILLFKGTKQQRKYIEIRSSIIRITGLWRPNGLKRQKIALQFTDFAFSRHFGGWFYCQFLDLFRYFCTFRRPFYLF